jgi:glycosyltransferase involved in cell wall biosynthesis
MAEAFQTKGPGKGEAHSEPTTADPAETLILDNFNRFQARVSQAESFLDQGNLELAAFQTMLAATIATHAHCGIFASKRLELVIRKISEKLVFQDRPVPRKTRATDVKRVLHIASEVSKVGGLSRMISRWISADPDRSNSLVLTRYREALPGHLEDAVKSSGGTIHLLNQKTGSMLDWVRHLRQIARDFDLIVLHTHCEDVLPLIAFAEGDKHPPALLLNHADHLFWLGPGSAHAVLNLRNAADEITRNRRGVAAPRSLMLPTLVDDTTWRQTKEQARQSLGISKDELVLLSVARGAKYRSPEGPSYADRFVPVLQENENARLIVVGSGMPDNWQAAAKATGGRIAGLSEQADPWKYFEAADIYVDSYPFSSSTSLMEAAGYELPLVTLFTAPDAASLVGINHLGLIGGVIQARSNADWGQALTRLLTDESFRRDQGCAARESVRIAQPDVWRTWLERAYDDALALPPLHDGAMEMPDATDTPYFGEPDRRHESIYGSDVSLVDIERDYIGLLSIKGRIRAIGNLSGEGHLRSLSETLRLLLPEWLKTRARRSRNT